MVAAVMVAAVTVVVVAVVAVTVVAVTVVNIAKALIIANQSPETKEAANRGGLFVARRSRATIRALAISRCRNRSGLFWLQQRLPDRKRIVQLWPDRRSGCRF
jgi:hypothetical protein